MKYIDLFAGAGGLSEGFIRAGYTPVAHVEMDEAACYTLKTRVAYHHLKSSGRLDRYYSYLKKELNRQELYGFVPHELLDTVINHPIGGDFNDQIHKKISKYTHAKEVDLIIGGPPCQAYSLVGRARSQNAMLGDPRNYLYVQYARYLEKYRPKMFVFENVVGLKSANGGIYLKNMEKLFFKKGYKMQLFNLEANKFGVLQNRKRIIILGWRDDFVPNLPDLEKFDFSSDEVVSSIFDDLPPLQSGEGKDRFDEYISDKPSGYLRKTELRKHKDVLTQHVARPHTQQDKEIYKIAVKKWINEKTRLDYNDLPEGLKTHNNRNSFFDRFKVVAPDLPFSQTVVAHIAKDGHYYIHPDLKQNRSITVREAARLQSFPDDYYFEGVREGRNRTAAFKQIGNAVPPLMATHTAFLLKPLLQ